MRAILLGLLLASGTFLAVAGGAAASVCQHTPVPVPAPAPPVSYGGCAANWVEYQSPSSHSIQNQLLVGGANTAAAAASVRAEQVLFEGSSSSGSHENEFTRVFLTGRVDATRWQVHVVDSSYSTTQNGQTTTTRALYVSGAAAGQGLFYVAQTGTEGQSCTFTVKVTTVAQTADCGPAPFAPVVPMTPRAPV